MAASHHSKVLILGGGPAGFTAAIYAARANLKPTLVMGMQPGGQLTITTDVENYPGFAETIQGPWLMEQFQKQAEHVGTNLVYDTIVSCDLKRHPFACVGDSGDTYTGDTLVIPDLRGYGRSVGPRTAARAARRGERAAFSARVARRSGNAGPPTGMWMPLRPASLPLRGPCMPFRRPRVPLFGATPTVSGPSVPLRGATPPRFSPSLPVEGAAMALQGTTLPLFWQSMGQRVRALACENRIVIESRPPDRRQFVGWW